MALKFWVGVTDETWFRFLASLPEVDEVNFWQPSGVPFRALPPGGLFLFKLHSPKNFIVGGGLFAHWSHDLPWSLAWETFGPRNGARTREEMRQRINRYRRRDPSDREDYRIGCILLEQPFFLDEAAWIPAPRDWSSNIVRGKGYDTSDPIGREIWDQVQAARNPISRVAEVSEIEAPFAAAGRFGAPQVVTPRLGQGSFRLLVLDSYERRCAVTRERTLPVLDAAHIQPYGLGGEHEISNGLLLRKDLHALFDGGYVTVSPDLRLEVSRRIREEFENGRDYYALHGKEVTAPPNISERPSSDLLAWHNANVYLG